MRRCYYGVHYIWVYGGTICWRRRSESRGFLHSLTAGIVSPFHLFRDFQFLVWCVGLVAFWGGRFLLFCVDFCWLPGLPFINSEMHKYVILSMTVTIVTMSAAMEQKKSFLKSWNTLSGQNSFLKLSFWYKLCCRFAANLFSFKILFKLLPFVFH